MAPEIVHPTDATAQPSAEELREIVNAQAETIAGFIGLRTITEASLARVAERDREAVAAEATIGALREVIKSLTKRLSDANNAAMAHSLRRETMQRQLAAVIAEREALLGDGIHTVLVDALTGLWDRSNGDDAFHVQLATRDGRSITLDLLSAIEAADDLDFPPGLARAQIVTIIASLILCWLRHQRWPECVGCLHEYGRLDIPADDRCSVCGVCQAHDVCRWECSHDDEVDDGD